MCEWSHVRHLPAGYSTWHPAYDHLRGTNKYGSTKDNSNPWSVDFSAVYDAIIERSFSPSFLFMTGDKHIWLEAGVQAIIGTYYTDLEVHVTKSSLSPNSAYNVILSNIEGNTNYPVVKLSTGCEKKCVLYKGGSAH